MNVFNTVTKLLFSKRMRVKMEPEFWPELFIAWLVIFRLFKVLSVFFFFAVFVSTVSYYLAILHEICLINWGEKSIRSVVYEAPLITVKWLSWYFH